MTSHGRRKTDRASIDRTLTEITSQMMDRAVKFVLAEGKADGFAEGYALAMMRVRILALMQVVGSVPDFPDVLRSRALRSPALVDPEVMAYVIFSERAEERILEGLSVYKPTDVYKEALSRKLRDPVRWFDCTCYFDCTADGATGTWHQHEDELCPVHPDAPIVG